ncbi:hypothetical protein [Nocardiopsis baichengensis]|nr:hypothetical protein [Nocardiopsis baichengensis]
MYLDPRALLRALATAHAAPACCGQPMAYTDAGGARGWYCVVNPLHVRI